MEINLLLDEKFDNFMLTSSDSDTCFQVLAIHPHVKETTVEFMGHSQQHNNFVFLQSFPNYSNSKFAKCVCKMCSNVFIVKYCMQICDVLVTVVIIVA